MAEVTLQNVRKSFEGNPVIKGVDLQIKEGELLVMVGPSGCGKSTLLRLVAGLETADEGTVLARGETPHAFRARGELGIAFQDPALLPWRTVRRNVVLPFQVLGIPAGQHSQSID